MENLKLYITRDEDNELYLTLVKPEKNIEQKKWKLDNVKRDTLILDNKLFPNVKWEDDEPLELLIETKPTQDVQNEYFKTVNLMLSDDYKERFIAEYRQLMIRLKKLENFINRIKAFDWCSDYGEGVCEVPKHDCSLELLERQLKEMENYAKTLRLRAVIEKINL